MTSLNIRAANPLKPLIIPAVLVAIWQYSAGEGLLNPILSSPAGIMRTLMDMITTGELWRHLQMSLLRLLVGLVGGSLVGIALGVLMASTRAADRIVTPSFRALMQVSAFAWIPLISVWMGTTEPARLTFIGFVCLFPVALNTYEGIRKIPKAYTEVAIVSALSGWRRFRLLTAPSAMPSIITGIELAMLYAWLATIGTELLMGNGVGVGSLMLAGQEMIQMELVFLGVLLSGAVGFAIASTAALLTKQLVGEGSGAIR
ncbi:MAG TPA: taurine ABC transporter permease [Marinobacter sp.]|nr:taurine ABC transporter permease [Marinobacter sp.]